jgi:hypothetical protein
MNTPIKVISIQQPFASLIAFGEKKFETRSWATKYRGELAIHASKKIDHQAALMVKEKYPEIWEKIWTLPTGVILATCRLADSHKIISKGYDSATLYADGIPKITGKEFAFGWYEFGRFAWELMDVQRIKPIPAKGQLGLWTFGKGETNERLE